MTQLVCWIARQPWCQHRDCFPALGAFECPHTEHQLVSKWALTVVTDHRGCQCAKAADKALLNSTAVLSKIIALPIKTKQKPSQQWNKSPVLLCRFTAGAWQGRGGEEGTHVGSCCSREGVVLLLLQMGPCHTAHFILRPEAKVRHECFLSRGSSALCCR